MSRTEEQIQELVREMYTTADSAEWDLHPEEVRSQKMRRRGVPLPDLKVLVLVAAVVILIVVGIVVAKGSPSHRSTAAGPTTTSSTVAPADTVTVPNAVNQPLAEASSALESAGLRLYVTNVVNNAASGSVLSQNPTAGSQVSRGSAVSLIVSSGTSGVRVPNLIGLSQAAAGNTLGQAGLNIGTVGSATSTQLAAGLVISESPVSGSSVVPGSSVDIVVSSGPPPASG